MRPDPGIGGRAAATVVAMLMSLPGPLAAQEPAALRYSAPVTVLVPGAFVRLPLPPAAYAHSREGALADLRLLDARGERVPFAVLRPRPEEFDSVEKTRPAAMYPLPPQAGADELPASIDLRIDGGKLVLRSTTGRVLPAAPAATRPGWLVDLGEREADTPAPRQLRLRWSGPAEFSAAYRLDTSADLRHWRPAAGGQVMALAAAPGAAATAGAGNGALVQPRVPLPADVPRYVRLRWVDPAAAPALTAMEAVSEHSAQRSPDPPTLLRLAPDAAPADAADPDAARAVQVDLGGVLELRTLDLALPPGTQVLPLRVQGRDRADARWRDLAAGVVYRIERPAEAGGTSVSPPLRLAARARFLRLVPDARAPAIDRARTQVLLQVQLAALVFASQGTPPYQLQLGATGAQAAADGALPLATLVPQLDSERARFGQAALGPVTELPEVARAVRRAEQLAAWRPWLLWAVLLAGVAGLAWMVWRLARGGAMAAPQAGPGGPAAAAAEAAQTPR